MSYTRKSYDNTVEGNYRTDTAGEGVTLYIGVKTYQVMSDIWENGSYAVIWNADEGRVQSIDWIEGGFVDATDEVVAAAKQWRKTQVYLRHYNKLKNEAEAEAVVLVRGCQARIVRGRKFPIGTEGKVVGFADNQWGRNVGLATSDELVEVVRNGRTYQNHKDVIWVAAKNVERADSPKIDMEAIDRQATAAAEHSLRAQNLWA